MDALGPPWGALGPPLGCFWAALGHILALFGGLLALFGALWPLSGRCRDTLGGFWVPLRALLGIQWMVCTLRAFGVCKVLEDLAEDQREDVLADLLALPSQPAIQPAS